jgi:hypothetical protein
MDALAFCSLYHGKLAGAVPVATSPGAWWELEKRGIPCILIQDCFDRMEIYRIGMENYRTLEAACRTIDTALRGEDEALRLHDLEPVKSDFCRLKYIFDNLSIRANLLKKLVQREKPDLVYVISSPEHERLPDSDPDAFFAEDRNWFPALLDLGVAGCPYERLGSGEEGGARPGNPEQPARRASLRETLARSDTFSLLLTVLRIHGPLRALRTVPSLVMNRFRAGRRLLVLGYGYDWNWVKGDLALEGYSLHSLRPDPPAAGGGAHPHGAWGERAQGLFVSDGTDLSSLVLPYVALRLGETLGAVPGAIDRIDREVRSGGYAAFLSGPRERAVEQVLARLAKGHSLPVLTWQHGAYGSLKAPIMLYAEFMNSDAILLWGTGVREVMEKDPLNTFPCLPRAVGSCELEALYRRRKPWTGKGSILYVTTNYYSNYLYVSYEYPFHDNEIWETQKAIIDTIGDRPGAVVKLHPSTTDGAQFEEFIRMRGYSGLDLVQGAKRSFTGLLEEAEVVIIDFPSTTLLQAIAAGKTIFVLTRYLSLSGPALATLQKRAYWSDDLGEFTALLEAYLDGETRGGPDPADTGFLELYGVHRLDGGVAGRALGVLEEIREDRRGGGGSG